MVSVLKSQFRPVLSGVYKIVSIQFPERVYIGSSVNMFRRFYIHEKALQRKKHHSVKLQNHVNKYGFSDLQFFVVEYCQVCDLIIREQFYINTFQPFFNINPVAGSRLGSVHSPEAKLKARKYVIQHKRQFRDFVSGKFISIKK
jgi:group I intron endonuclease